MKQRTLNINIPGRVKKVRTTDPFVPLFEAISNTFHATQDLDQDLRKVNVKIVRSSQPQLADETENEKPITGFEIEDNGVGFSEENMDSFCLSDSTHKEKSGGKGVGRFSWLKFFDQAEVTSVFKAGEKKQKRKFIFSMQGVHEDRCYWGQLDLP